MERSMEIKLLSARDLPNVNLLSKMDAYAVVELLHAGAGAGKPTTKQKFKSPVDKDGGSNPIWNFSMKFAVDEAAARANRLTLVFKLRCQRNLGDRDIGDVHVPVRELLDSVSGAGAWSSMQHLSYQVRKPSGNPQGVLNFGFRFGDNSAVGPVIPDPVEAANPVGGYPTVSAGGVYPPPPPPPKPEPYPPSSNLYPALPPKVTAPLVPETGYGVYPQPGPAYSAYSPAPSYSAYSPSPAPVQSGYGFQQQPPPMAPAYGYPPPPAYGYQPQPAYYPPPPQHKKNNMGLGLGAGLVGGMVGGLLIGDLVSDAAAYDAGYDAGFVDSGGFGF